MNQFFTTDSQWTHESILQTDTQWTRAPILQTPKGQINQRDSQTTHKSILQVQHRPLPKTVG